jgi:T5orf172 domain
VTLNSVVWANALTNISPTAKLIAIDFASVSGGEEIGRRTVADLAEFACCTSKDVEVALIELGAVLKIERDGERIHAAFPTRPDKEDVSARRLREKAYEDQRRHHLYVISKGGKIKIGISGQLQKRLTALQASFPIETEVLLAVSGPYRAIRRAEMDAHAALKDCALGGEYFDTSQERALEVTKSALVHHGVDVTKSKGVEAIR